MGLRSSGVARYQHPSVLHLDLDYNHNEGHCDVILSLKEVVTAVTLWIVGQYLFGKLPLCFYRTRTFRLCSTETRYHRKLND